MFNNNFDITGVHANYLKELCELRGNVADKDEYDNFKIFTSYVDAYVLCPIIGFIYNRKAPMGKPVDGNVGILADQIIRRKSELKYIYEIILLLDDEFEPELENRIVRAFRLSEDNEEDMKMIEENLNLFNEYFLGGLEVFHEEFFNKCIDRDAYLERMHEIVQKFNNEQDSSLLKSKIQEMLS